MAPTSPTGEASPPDSDTEKVTGSGSKGTLAVETQTSGDLNKKKRRSSKRASNANMGMGKTLSARPLRPSSRPSLLGADIARVSSVDSNPGAPGGDIGRRRSSILKGGASLPDHLTNNAVTRQNTLMNQNQTRSVSVMGATGEARRTMRKIPLYSTNEHDVDEFGRPAARATVVTMDNTGAEDQSRSGGYNPVSNMMRSSKAFIGNNTVANMVRGSLHKTALDFGRDDETAKKRMNAHSRRILRRTQKSLRKVALERNNATRDMKPTSEDQLRHSRVSQAPHSKLYANWVGHLSDTNINQLLVETVYMTSALNSAKAARKAQAAKAKRTTYQSQRSMTGSSSDSGVKSYMGLSFLLGGPQQDSAHDPTFPCTTLQPVSPSTLQYLDRTVQVLFERTRASLQLENLFFHQPAKKGFAGACAKFLQTRGVALELSENALDDAFVSSMYVSCEQTRERDETAAMMEEDVDVEEVDDDPGSPTAVTAKPSVWSNPGPRETTATVGFGGRATTASNSRETTVTVGAGRATTQLPTVTDGQSPKGGIGSGLQEISEGVLDSDHASSNGGTGVQLQPQAQMISTLSTKSAATDGGTKAGAFTTIASLRPAITKTSSEKGAKAGGGVTKTSSEKGAKKIMFARNTVALVPNANHGTQLGRALLLNDCANLTSVGCALLAEMCNTLLPGQHSAARVSVLQLRGNHISLAGLGETLKLQGLVELDMSFNDLVPVVTRTKYEVLLQARRVMNIAERMQAQCSVGTAGGPGSNAGDESLAKLMSSMSPAELHATGIRPMVNHQYTDAEETWMSAMLETPTNASAREGAHSWEVMSGVSSISSASKTSGAEIIEKLVRERVTDLADTKFRELMKGERDVDTREEEDEEEDTLALHEQEIIVSAGGIKPASLRLKILGDDEHVQDSQAEMRLTAARIALSQDLNKSVKDILDHLRSSPEFLSELGRDGRFLKAIGCGDLPWWKTVENREVKFVRVRTGVHQQPKMRALKSRTRQPTKIVPVVKASPQKDRSNVSYVRAATSATSDRLQHRLRYIHRDFATLHDALAHFRAYQQATTVTLSKPLPPLQFRRSWRARRPLCSNAHARSNAMNLNRQLGILHKSGARRGHRRAQRTKTLVCAAWQQLQLAKCAVDSNTKRKNRAIAKLRKRYEAVVRRRVLPKFAAQRERELRQAEEKMLAKRRESYVPVEERLQLTEEETGWREGNVRRFACRELSKGKMTMVKSRRAAVKAKAAKAAEKKAAEEKALEELPLAKTDLPIEIYEEPSEGFEITSATSADFTIPRKNKVCAFFASIGDATAGMCTCRSSRRVRRSKSSSIGRCHPSVVIHHVFNLFRALLLVLSHIGLPEDALPKEVGDDQTFLDREKARRENEERFLGRSGVRRRKGRKSKKSDKKSEESHRLDQATLEAREAMANLDEDRFCTPIDSLSACDDREKLSSDSPDSSPKHGTPGFDRSSLYVDKTGEAVIQVVAEANLSTSMSETDTDAEHGQRGRGKHGNQSSKLRVLAGLSGGSASESACEDPEFSRERARQRELDAIRLKQMMPDRAIVPATQLSEDENTAVNPITHPEELPNQERTLADIEREQAAEQHRREQQVFYRCLEESGGNFSSAMASAGMELAVMRRRDEEERAQVRAAEAERLASRAVEQRTRELESREKEVERRESAVAEAEAASSSSSSTEIAIQANLGPEAASSSSGTGGFVEAVKGGKPPRSSDFDDDDSSSNGNGDADPNCNPQDGNPQDTADSQAEDTEHPSGLSSSSSSSSSEDEEATPPRVSSDSESQLFGGLDLESLAADLASVTESVASKVSAFESNGKHSARDNVDELASEGASVEHGTEGTHHVPPAPIRTSARPSQLQTRPGSPKRRSDNDFNRVPSSPRATDRQSRMVGSMRGVDVVGKRVANKNIHLAPLPHWDKDLLKLAKLRLLRSHELCRSQILPGAAFQSLRRLRLVSCKLGPLTFGDQDALLNNPPRHLQLLDLSYNPELGGQSVANLLTACYHGRSRLSLLGLSCCGLVAGDFWFPGDEPLNDTTADQELALNTERNSAVGIGVLSASMHGATSSAGALAEDVVQESLTKVPSTLSPDAGQGAMKKQTSIWKSGLVNTVGAVGTLVKGFTKAAPAAQTPAPALVAVPAPTPAPADQASKIAKLTSTTSIATLEESPDSPKASASITEPQLRPVKNIGPAPGTNLLGDRSRGVASLAIRTSRSGRRSNSWNPGDRTSMHAVNELAASHSDALVPTGSRNLLDIGTHSSNVGVRSIMLKPSLSSGDLSVSLGPGGAAGAISIALSQSAGVPTKHSWNPFSGVTKMLSRVKTHKDAPADAGVSPIGKQLSKKSDSADNLESGGSGAQTKDSSGPFDSGGGPSSTNPLSAANTGNQVFPALPSQGKIDLALFGPSLTALSLNQNLLEGEEFSDKICTQVHDDLERLTLFSIARNPGLVFRTKKHIKSLLFKVQPQPARSVTDATCGTIHESTDLGLMLGRNVNATGKNSQILKSPSELKLGGQQVALSFKSLADQKRDVEESRDASGRDGNAGPASAKDNPRFLSDDILDLLGDDNDLGVDPEFDPESHPSNALGENETTRSWHLVNLTGCTRLALTMKAEVVHSGMVEARVEDEASSEEDVGAGLGGFFGGFAKSMGLGLRGAFKGESDTKETQAASRPSSRPSARPSSRPSSRQQPGSLGPRGGTAASKSTVLFGAFASLESSDALDSDRLFSKKVQESSPILVKKSVSLAPDLEEPQPDAPFTPSHAEIRAKSNTTSHSNPQAQTITHLQVLERKLTAKQKRGLQLTFPGLRDECVELFERGHWRNKRAFGGDGGATVGVPGMAVGKYPFGKDGSAAQGPDHGGHGGPTQSGHHDSHHHHHQGYMSRLVGSNQKAGSTTFVRVDNEYLPQGFWLSFLTEREVEFEIPNAYQRPQKVVRQPGFL